VESIATDDRRAIEPDLPVIELHLGGKPSDRRRDLGDGDQLTDIEDSGRVSSRTGRCFRPTRASEISPDVTPCSNFGLGRDRVRSLKVSPIRLGVTIRTLSAAPMGRSAVRVIGLDPVGDPHRSQGTL
jgi:hypothetical protein